MCVALIWTPSQALAFSSQGTEPAPSTPRPLASPPGSTSHQWYIHTRPTPFSSPQPPQSTTSARPAHGSRRPPAPPRHPRLLIRDMQDRGAAAAHAGPLCIPPRFYVPSPDSRHQTLARTRAWRQRPTLTPCAPLFPSTSQQSSSIISYLCIHVPIGRDIPQTFIPPQTYIHTHHPFPPPSTRTETQDKT